MSDSESDHENKEVAINDGDGNSDDEKAEDETTFTDLGLVDVLCEAAKTLGWKKPTKIQKEAIPIALEGKDIIGLAETGHWHFFLLFNVPDLSLLSIRLIFTSHFI